LPLSATRLGETLEEPSGLQRLDDGAELLFAVEEEQVQEIAERELLSRSPGVVEQRPGGLIRRRARQVVLVPARAGEQRDAGVRQGAAAHFREANVEQDLIAAAAFSHLEQRNELVLGIDEAAGQPLDLRLDILARDRAREHGGLAVRPDVDRFLGEQFLELRGQTAEVALHDDVVPADGAGSIPHEHRDRPGRLAVDEQLVRRRHQRVRDVGARQRHARDRLAEIDDRRPADEQPHRVGGLGGRGGGAIEGRDRQRPRGLGVQRGPPHDRDEQNDGADEPAGLTA
jgi:hypothetical protein